MCILFVTLLIKVNFNILTQGRVDCIRSATTEALEWAKAMCQGEGANVGLDASENEVDSEGKKVKFNIYSVSRSLCK